MTHDGPSRLGVLAGLGAGAASLLAAPAVLRA